MTHFVETDIHYMKCHHHASAGEWARIIGNHWKGGEAFRNNINENVEGRSEERRIRRDLGKLINEEIKVKHTMKMEIRFTRATEIQLMRRMDNIGHHL